MYMDNPDLTILTTKAINLLKQLILTPSFSRQEDQTATLIHTFFRYNNVEAFREGNNVWARNKYYDALKPTILLNSHHDTVQPNGGYTVNPFDPVEVNGKLYGLGSNDAGGALVGLAATFLYFNETNNLPFNLVFAASAEEEISGKDGVESLFPLLPSIQAAIVGEPTRMQMAVAERGLLVLDCIAYGRAGHAARNEGENSIYKAITDINNLLAYRFNKVSTLLGEVQLNITVIETGNKAHNVIPAECKFTIDVRVNELYSLEEVLTTIRELCISQVNPRSLRLKSSAISLDHPLVKAGKSLNKTCYGSPTTSDSALIPVPTLKIGPGDSARSHIANEFIYIYEIQQGIAEYINLLKSADFNTDNFIL